MKCFRVWSYYWEKYATEAELCMDGSADAVFEDDDGVPHHENTDLVIEFDTGLKDKNGKEIYWGDIVNVIGVGIAQVIDSPSGEWMLYYKREPDEIKNGFVCVVPKNKPSGLWKANLTSYIEVIGNIHENPELLEGEG